MKVRLTQRRSADARCAYCHDSLDGVVSSCSRCLTTFHKDCRAHMAQCPTLGCGTVFTHAPEVVADIEAEPTAGLVDQLARENPLTVGVGGLAAVLLAVLAASRVAWDQDSFVVLGFLILGFLWPLLTVLRAVPFLLAAQALLARTPLRMVAEVRSEQRRPGGDAEGEPERVFVVNLLGPAGEHLSFSDATVPAWLLAPGAKVDVFSAPESGPIVLRSARGDVHAVRAERVWRAK